LRDVRHVGVNQIVATPFRNYLLLDSRQTAGIEFKICATKLVQLLPGQLPIVIKHTVPKFKTEDAQREF